MKRLRIRRSWLGNLLARFFGHKRVGVFAAAFLILVVLMAVFADFLASEKPIIAKVNNKLYLFPCLFYESELADYDNQALEVKLAKDGGWAIVPPIPYGPNQSKISGQIDWLQPPSAKHLLGTDRNGRDVMARLIHGARSAMFVAIGAIVISIFLGILLGAFSAYFGGKLDRLTTVVIETMTTFPTLFLILGIQGLLGISTLWQLAVLIGATTWMEVARVTRAEVLRTMNEEYVDAARALGLGHRRILLRHVMPQVMGPVMVAGTFGIANAILIESTLSFLGYGAPPPTASWGQLVADAFQSYQAYWLSVVPGILLTLTVLSVNITGEGLSDSADNY